MKNSKKIRLTNSELAMMQLLWEAGRPLNRGEIMEIAQRDPDDPLFARNSFHVIINNLMDNGYLDATMNDGPGRKNARHFSPLLTRNEYFARQITMTDHYTSADIPDIVAALVKADPSVDPDALLRKIRAAVKAAV